MKRFWANIPDSLKMTAGTVLGVFAVVSYLTLFQTDAEAMETEKRIYLKLDKTRIEVNEQKIKDYEFKLLEPDLTDQQIQWIDRQIKTLEKKNNCIRDSKC